MTRRIDLPLTIAKNYCNRTPIVKVIVENVVTCFLGTHCTLYVVFVASGVFLELLVLNGIFNERIFLIKNVDKIKKR